MIHFISPPSLCSFLNTALLSFFSPNRVLARCVLFSLSFIQLVVGKELWRLMPCFQFFSNGETHWVKVVFWENKVYLMEVYGVRWLRVLVKLPLTGLCLHSQPPLVQTHTVTITAASNSLPSGVSTTEVPVVPTKTLVFESSKVGAQPGSLPPGRQFAWWTNSPAKDRKVLVGPGRSSRSLSM